MHPNRCSACSASRVQSVRKKTCQRNTITASDTRTYTYIHHTHTYMYIHTYVYTHVYTHANTHTQTNIHTHSTHACTYTHTSTMRQLESYVESIRPHEIQPHYTHTWPREVQQYRCVRHQVHPPTRKSVSKSTSHTRVRSSAEQPQTHACNSSAIAITCKC